MTQIEKEFIKAFHITEEEYYFDTDGDLHFKSDYTLVRCNIFGMGWILGRQHDVDNYPVVLIDVPEIEVNIL